MQVHDMLTFCTLPTAPSMAHPACRPKRMRSWKGAPSTWRTVCVCISMGMIGRNAPQSHFTQQTTCLQPLVGTHGAEALVALQGHEELDAPNQGLVGQGLHACLVDWFRMCGASRAVGWMDGWMDGFTKSPQYAPGIRRTSRCVRLPPAAAVLAVAAAVVCKVWGLRYTNRPIIQSTPQTHAPPADQRLRETERSFSSSPMRQMRRKELPRFLLHAPFQSCWVGCVQSARFAFPEFVSMERKHAPRCSRARGPPPG